MQSSPRDTDSQSQPHRRRVGLATVLVGGVTLLILLAVGSVLWVTLTSATRNTFELLGQQATATLDVLEARVDGQLDSVVRGMADFGAQFADGRLNITDKRAQTLNTFSGFLSSHPQVLALIYIGKDMNSLTVTRQEGYVIEVPAAPVSDDRRAFALNLASEKRDPFWGDPLWVAAANGAVLTHLAPVWRGDNYEGVVLAPVSLSQISAFLKVLEDENNMSAFILHNHDRVLAHPRLEEASFPAPPTPTGNALPTLENVPEPAFGLLKGEGDEALLLLEFAANVTNARADDDTIIITRDTEKFGPALWTLGLKLERAIVGREVDRLVTTTIFGIGIMFVAILVGFLFARRLNKQIGQLVRAAGALTELEIADAPKVPDSRIRELSEAARAFNRMTAALRLFEVYVPKQLVLRMMRGGETQKSTEGRVLTVMFTDIRGFSTIAEQMDASGTAALLNEHFDMLAEPIEAEGGTVDKYIGDAIMAFWGAPEQMPDHAARAIRAAAEIQRRVRADNVARIAAGKPVIAVRVGIHTGPVVVGNIGSRNRINYTIVGDAVNIASRIDSIAKEVAGEEHCVVLVSGDAYEHAGHNTDADYTLEPLGTREIRGRKGTVDIFRLDTSETGHQSGAS